MLPGRLFDLLFLYPLRVPWIRRGEMWRPAPRVSANPPVVLMNASARPSALQSPPASTTWGLELNTGLIHKQSPLVELRIQIQDSPEDAGFGFVAPPVRGRRP